MTHTIKLCSEYIKRTNDAITETRKLINKEMQVSIELRYTHKIEQWEKHIEKLEGYLKAGEIVSVIPN